MKLTTWLLVLPLFLVDVQFAAAGTVPCPGVMVDKQTWNMESLGRDYACYDSARDAERADYYDEVLCAGGAFETVGSWYMSGEGTSKQNSKVFKVGRSPMIIEYSLYGSGSMKITLTDYATGKKEGIVSTKNESEASVAINKRGTYYITVDVDSKANLFNENEERDPASWEVNIETDSYYF